MQAASRPQQACPRLVRHSAASLLPPSSHPISGCTAQAFHSSAGQLDSTHLAYSMQAGLGGHPEHAGGPAGGGDGRDPNQQCSHGLRRRGGGWHPGRPSQPHSQRGLGLPLRQAAPGQGLVPRLSPLRSRTALAQGEWTACAPLHACGVVVRECVGLAGGSAQAAHAKHSLRGVLQPCWHAGMGCEPCTARALCGEDQARIWRHCADCTTASGVCMLLDPQRRRCMLCSLSAMAVHSYGSSS